MSGQMKVDLSELEETVRKLKRMAADMDGASSNAKYDTSLSDGALGVGEDFGEAVALRRAHAEMKSHIEEIVTYLNQVIDDFGKKTQTTHGSIQDAEAEAKSGFSG